MRKLCWIFAAAAVALSASHPSDRCAAKGKGLILPTDQEKQEIEKQWKVNNVQPTKIGAARIKMAAKKAGEPAPAVTAAGSDQEFSAAGTLVDAAILPKAVNNALLPSFPPIGDQGLLGSCVAWATTYYQATHEIGLMGGTNNKTGFETVLSPKWTYNMINYGEDAGSYVSEAYYLLSQNGAATMPMFPYDNDYLGWDTNSQHWLGAISNRMSQAKAIGGVNASPQNLTQIKQALANGHVLTFCTYINDWRYTRIKTDPSGLNQHVGEYAATWVAGTEGGHCMTIVGYNDDLWIDVNGNGRVDPGERGAFLVANSWGPEWGNNGFIWISYDAFLTNSAVAGGPSSGRVPAAAPTNSYFILALPKAPQYTPTLVAEFNLSQTERDQIKITAGVSEPNLNGPTKYFQSGALFYQGGSIPFDGMASGMAEMGTFYLDLTDLASTSPKKYYFMIKDNEPMNPTTLNSLTLIDLKSGMEAYGKMKIVDNGKITAPLEFSVASAAPAKALSASLVYPGVEETVSGAIPLVARTTNPTDTVEFYVNGRKVGVDREAPYFVLYDTERLRNGTHLVSIISYDGITYATDHVRIHVQN